MGRRLLALTLLAASLVGCGAGEVSNADQAAKMKTLHEGEAASQAKDGIKTD